MNTFLTCILYVLGIVLLVNQKITLGGLLAFITYSVYLISPIDIVLNIKTSFQEIRPSIDSLSAFFSLEVDDINEEMNLPDNIESINFNNVSVIVDEKTILENVSFSIKVGEKVAIVGENGSGKTTLLNLLLKIMDPTSGTISLNNVAIDKINTEIYRAGFGVVTQRVNLFNSDILENITLNNDEACFNLNKIHEIDDILKGMSYRLHDSVGACGDLLSGGEKQKIAFLRAYCSNRQVLVLDEVTSNLDECSKKILFDLIRKTKRFKTVIVVTHASEMLEEFDQIIKLDKGKIEEVRRNNKNEQCCD